MGEEVETDVGVMKSKARQLDGCQINLNFTRLTSFINGHTVRVECALGG